MRTELHQITPELARKILERNTSNRRLRPGVVENFRRLHDQGLWKVSHQGIAIGSNGVVLDGQHRLHMVASLPDGCAVAMNVSVDCDPDTFDVIDSGEPRDISDKYGISKSVSAVARIFAKIHKPNLSMTHQEIVPYCKWVEPEFDDLLTAAPKATRIWSSGSCRAAAVYQLKRGRDADTIKSSYRALVLGDINGMPPGARLLMEQYISGKIKSTHGGSDLFIRAVKAFDTSKAKPSRLVVGDSDVKNVFSEVREFVASQIEPSVIDKLIKKKAA